MTGDDRVITVGKNGFFVLKDSASTNSIHRITLDSSGKGILVELMKWVGHETAEKKFVKTTYTINPLSLKTCTVKLFFP